MAAYYILKEFLGSPYNQVKLNLALLPTRFNLTSIKPVVIDAALRRAIWKYNLPARVLTTNGEVFLERLPPGAYPYLETSR